jgi:hypothetical protein
VATAEVVSVTPQGETSGVEVVDVVFDIRWKA